MGWLKRVANPMICCPFLINVVDYFQGLIVIRWFILFVKFIDVNFGIFKKI